MIDKTVYISAFCIDIMNGRTYVFLCFSSKTV